MLVEPETVRLEYYWHDENKTLCHKYIWFPLEIVRKARMIERYTFAYRLEIDGKKYSYRSYRNKSTRKRQHFIDYIIQDMNENLEGFGNKVIKEQMTIFDFLEETDE
ncbi:TPA: hypothetical protein U1265_000785 [Streptococcus suis]|nr:hypothetical protein [Streptococcus suis]HEM5101682.1 hypothetical protein [Streptococcus suis]HEM5108272.1 hypothetical protein [Streptococcus suis]HEM5126288.1 hypothetical protein [Streptococcus suis]HEM5135036.1 hypothetical protein [Streptococcus suis]